MSSDYARISAENEKKYGTEVSYYGSDFADRYTERTHFIFELLQNAEDALRWREEIEPGHRLPRKVDFILFEDHLEVTHYGLPFSEDHVRAICSIKRGTKHQNLTDIGKFGIGFKSVYAYTRRPEVHSGEEHFVIESYVHPRSTPARETRSGQTLFYIPFDHDEIPAEKAHAEISARLPKLGFRTLLFLDQIESVVWKVAGKASGRYLRRTEHHDDYKEVLLVGQASPATRAKSGDRQHWIVFARPVGPHKGEPAGKVEVAFELAPDGKGSRHSIVPAKDSNLIVFFPTEKETHCGFLMQGPYKTTPSRDNIPHDNKWNSDLVRETAILVAESLVKLADLQLATVGLLQALPLQRNAKIQNDWMFRPVYDAIVTTLKAHALIPAVGGRLVSGRCARIARGKGLADLFTPDQLSLLLGTDQDDMLDWVTPEISESRSDTWDLFAFLRYVIDVEQIEPEALSPHLTEDFFQAQPTAWMVKFYTFLLDHESLWRRDKTRGRLLEQPFVRLKDNRHVAPFRSDGAPNAYLPGGHETDFDTVHPKLAKPKFCSEFLRKLGLTEPDVTSEVLQEIVPQYERDEIDIPDKNHRANLRKIFRALMSDSPSRTALVERLKDLTFLGAAKPSSEDAFLCKPGSIYFRRQELETFLDQHEDVRFLAEPPDLVGRDKIRALLQELGVEDKPRRIQVERDPNDIRDIKEKLRRSSGRGRDIHFIDYDLDGLGGFLKSLKKLSFADASRRAHLLWRFLLRHLDGYDIGTERNFFRGEYEWHYRKQFTFPFDAYFITVLRSKAWLPGKDGELHKPSELLPQEVASVFQRNAVLCDELQMKAAVLVTLAKEAGLKVEDIVFIREHREEFESLKRSMKEKPPRTAKPVLPPSTATPSPSSSRPGAASATEERPWPPGVSTPEPVPARDTPAARAPSPDEVAIEISAILGADSATRIAIQAGLNKPESAHGARTGVTAPGRGEPSQCDASSTSVRSHSQSGGDRQQDGKFFTYVYNAPNTLGEAAWAAERAEEIARREKVARAGVDCVISHERKAGRQPSEMPSTHEGYDVEFRNGNGEVERYIEVKAISSGWGERGVTLSQPQFEAARRLKDKYWLYVVENAGTSPSRVHRIQNPALRVGNYAYDQGWRELAEADGAA